MEPFLPEAEEALHRAVVGSRLDLEVPGVGGSLAWSPAGVFVTEGPENSGMIDIRDAETGESVLSFQGHDGDVNDVAFSSDGSKLASTGDDGKLKVWESATGRLVSSRVGRRRCMGPFVRRRRLTGRRSLAASGHGGTPSDGEFGFWTCPRIGVVSTVRMGHDPTTPPSVLTENALP